MSMENTQRRGSFSWLYVGPVFVLCGILGYLQYDLIGKVRDAARQSLHGSLQASLTRVSQEVDTEIAAATAAVAPANSVNDADDAEQQVRTRYEQWKQTARHGRMFVRVALAVPQGTVLELRNINPADAASRGVWPASLVPLRHRLERSLVPKPWAGQGGDRPPPPDMPMRPDEEGLTMEFPLFPPPPSRPTPGLSPAPFGRREVAWVLFELSPEYLRSTLLPEILQRQLGTGGNLDYRVWVVSRSNPESVLYQSDPSEGRGVIKNADASVSLFDPQYDQFLRRAGGRGRGLGPGPMPGRGPSSEGGRWLLYVRHRAGSLEAVVARARLFHLAVTGAVLLLMVATLAALIRYTRRAQQLAELQMEFVAGVSHELRTPLTVIHTAAYNLRGKLANNPTQVERYGALIQQESGRLKELVENVLQFSSAKAGRVIQEREPLSVETVIEQAVDSSKAAIASAHCLVEKSIAPHLPQILGDPVALRQALANLVGNAAKYGTAETHWIGISASPAGDNGHQAVEICVADRGPGIPAEEQAHIFDPFFRGARAVQDQVHGTGLGLSLVKRIVEAHGGSIRVKSAPMKGAEFIVTIPAAPAGGAA
ncbi:putative Integral membrane sensor signal transduction histidine kinase [Candidatus Sulfopaludibacter sp. SbA3]|nr:putative Integral membrane sensor signal transduction histidine kinase [Candidatus Sulfopaludibacter sp. SbA3]